MSKDKKDKKFSIDWFSVGMFTFLTIISLILIYIIFWVFITSLKVQEDFRVNKLGLPKWFVIQNYQYILNHFTARTYVAPYEYIGVGEQLINTLLYVLVTALLQTIIPCLTAYAATKYDFFFSKILSFIVLMVLSLPIVGSQPSEIQLLRQLGLYDTFVGVYLMKGYFISMYFFVFSAVFKSINKSFYEAAEIDGGGQFTMLFNIALPMAFYTITTVFLIMFITHWNEYQSILVYLPSHLTISVGLQRISEATQGPLTLTPLKMAGCTVIMLPTLLIYIFFNKKVLGNVSMGGVKE